MTIKVAVTGAGGPPAVSFLQAVAEPSVELFGADVDPYAPGLYLVHPEHRWILRRGDDPRFVDDVLERCAAAHIDVLVPTVGCELLPLARQRAEFARRGVTLPLANEDTLALCLETAALMARCAGVCPVSPNAAAQGALSGNEYSVDVLCTRDGEVLAAVPRCLLKTHSSAEVAGVTLHDARLEAYARGVARAVGMTYVAAIQFREDASGLPHLVAVTARFPAAMPLTVASGVNMPRLALDMALGYSVLDAGDFREVGMVRVWRDHFVEPEEITVLERLAEPRDAPPRRLA